jgi:hypothetical protein
MAYTAPGTAVAGDVLTAAFWNQQVRDNMEAVAGSPFARNILYNGAMQVAQRGTSTASITTQAYYTADRWSVGINTHGTWTQSVENDAPTGSGFRKSLKMLCTTADASPAAADRILIQQPLEGFDLQRIAKGTSSAQELTLSFWVKSNVTGTYIASLYDNNNTRHVSKTYTISASATWEKKTITFPADTTGAFTNDNAASLYLVLYLGAGSNWTSGTLATSWASFVAANDATGQTNLAAATNNYWQITGVQLETGSVATSFEFLPYGDELRRCQRYFLRIAAASYTPIGIAATDATTSGRCIVHLPNTMRTSPTSITRGGTAPISFPGTLSTLTLDKATTTAIMLSVGGTSFTAGGASAITGSSDGTTYIDVNGAEL